MNKSLEIVFGFFVIILVAVGFAVAGFLTMPSSQEVAGAITEKVETVSVPDDNTINQLSQKIKGYERNGALPVVVNDTEIGKANPFLPN